MAIKIAVMVTLILSQVPIKCDTVENADGCYHTDTNTLEIYTGMSGSRLRYVLLHEVAHAKYNTNKYLEVFDELRGPYSFTPNNKFEKMADWFYAMWSNPANFKKEHKNWYAFFKLFGLEEL